MNQPLVSIENLHVRFRTYAGVVHAVNGVTFDIRRGETFGLVGETGCGKTVTGLSLLRLVPPPGEIVDGRITFDGRDILSLSEQEMQDIRGAGISMIFQDPAASLNPVFSVGEQIEMVIRQHQSVTRKIARQRTLEMLEAVGLPDPPQILRAYAHELSGGMQQRVMIALALAQEPEVLLLDEPTVHLDLAHQVEVLELIAGLNGQRGLTVLAVLHDLNLAALYFPRLVLLERGRIVAEGAPMQVLSEETIARVFGATVRVQPHPTADRPHIIVLPG